MPDASLHRLLERLASLPDAADTPQTRRHMLQLIDNFRKEREAIAGPLNEQQWRGILLSALDLVQHHNGDHMGMRNALGEAIGQEDAAA